MGIDFNAVPEELKSCPHWLLWKYEERDGKKTKVPYQVNGGKKASSTNPKTWCTFDAAKKALEFRLGDGIGFVFTKDSFSGVDLDHCCDPSTGAIDAWAVRYIEILKSYSEVSPSGEGIHVIVKGSIPEGATGGKKYLVGPDYRPKAGIEVYSEGRYFTFTGNSLNGNITVQDRQEELRESIPRDLRNRGKAPRGKERRSHDGRQSPCFEGHDGPKWGSFQSSVGRVNTRVRP